jgi:hypothetical protein
MKIVISILTTFILTSHCYCQKSDLKIATHQFEYLGDSIKLKKIIKALQSDSIRLLPKRDQICELRIADLGTTDSMKFSVYHLEYGLGVSCHGIFRTLFFKGDTFIGSYNSDIASPDKIDRDKLIWKFEDDKTISMDLSSEIPHKFLFGQLERRLIED